eukprot:TRINITY_DN11720_c0_g1_i3.p1 TRINITY_DN11720_c0_g1~~TRINITY_DN11720_c0_g1_i3.p1  ORF type:complete len:208 (+),score=28.04 TRINITY_DN11720_c0_g1_i3:55-624(+)
MLANISPKARRQHWISRCGVKEAITNTLHKFSYYSHKECKYAADIERDIERTFNSLHNEPRNIERLRSVLNAFAVKNSDVGYTQGLNFIAGHLLLQFPNELAFWILDALANKHQLKGFLKDKMPKLKVALYQLEQLVKAYLPDIHNDLRRKEVSYELFAVQWFLTLFSFDFEPSYLNTCLLYTSDAADE